MQDLDNGMIQSWEFENENMYDQKKLTPADNSAVPIVKKPIQYNYNLYEILANRFEYFTWQLFHDSE